MKKGGREARADQPYQPVTAGSVVCVSVGMGRVGEGGRGGGLTNHCGLRTSFIVAS